MCFFCESTALDAVSSDKGGILSDILGSSMTVVTVGGLSTLSCRLYLCLNPLTTTRYKNAGQLWEFLTTLFLNGLHCKFYTAEPCPSAVYSKKQNQFIIYRTHFRSVYLPKSRFFGKNAMHCSGALLKKRKRFFLYFLNGYRYHKNFNRFEFQALKAIFSTILNKFWWKISPHC